MRRIVLVIILIVLPNAAWGQLNEGPVNITVESQTDGPTGQALVHEVRERIRASEGFYLTYNEPLIGLRLKVMDIPNARGAAYSFALTMELKEQSYFYDHAVGTFPPDQVEQTARALVGSADSFRSKIAKKVQQLMDKNSSGGN